MGELETVYRQIGRLYALNYAAIGSGLGKLKPKQCKTGFPCGYSCISKAKNCKSGLTGQSRTYAEWLSRQVEVEPQPKSKKKTSTKTPKAPKTPEPPQPPQNPQSFQEFIDRGRAYGKEELDAIDKAVARAEKNKSYKKLRSDLDTEFASVLKAFQEDPGLAVAYARDPMHEDPRLAKWRDLKMQISKEDESIQNEVEGNMRSLRDKMLGDGISKDDADRLLSNVAISTEITDSDAKEIEATIVEAARITNGKGAQSLGYIVQTQDRAHAMGREINIGLFPDREVLYHEFGHHVEFESDSIRQAAVDFVKNRATGDIKPLNEITNSDAFEKKEMAYPDNFISPYVGKVYRDGATEVISMGLEYFRDEASMLKLYRADREHFEFMLGVLR